MLRIGARVALLSTALVGSGLSAGCDPYDRYGKGDDSLGPVDPVNFPPANLGVQSDGTPGNRRMSGIGAFTATAAYVGGATVSYFSYPIATPTAADPLRLLEDDAPNPEVPTSDVYVFDPAYTCTSPAGYKPDKRLDEVPLNEQGNIFTALPTATYTPERGPRSRYIPVVSEIALPASTAGMSCQQPKSPEILERLTGVKEADRVPSGRYLAYLAIDPGAAVFPVGKDASSHPGVGIQSWGWFNRYLLAYIDGGVVPTADAMVMEGTPPAAKKIKRMVTQKLYYPRSMVTDAMGMAAPGQLGAGYDTMTAKRGDAGYSPLCEVFTYDAGAAMTVEKLPKNAADIEANFNTMTAPLMADTPPYVFCLQVVAQ